MSVGQIGLYRQRVAQAVVGVFRSHIRRVRFRAAVIGLDCLGDPAKVIVVVLGNDPEWIGGGVNQTGRIVSLASHQMRVVALGGAGGTYARCRAIWTAVRADINRGRLAVGCVVVVGYVGNPRPWLG